MARLMVLLSLLLASCVALACDKPAVEPSVDDVVFNNISPQTMELDQELQSSYGCRYPFAMLFSSDGYTPMKLVSGSQPATPVDATGAPITGTVFVGFVLNTDGMPIDPVVLRSEDDRLAAIALNHVLGLRYTSSQFNGRAVRSLGIQVYQFK